VPKELNSWIDTLHQNTEINECRENHETHINMPPLPSIHLPKTLLEAFLNQANQRSSTSTHKTGDNHPGPPDQKAHMFASTQALDNNRSHAHPSLDEEKDVQARNSPLDRHHSAAPVLETTSAWSQKRRGTHAGNDKAGRCTFSEWFDGEEVCEDVLCWSCDRSGSRRVSTPVGVPWLEAYRDTSYLSTKTMFSGPLKLTRVSRPDTGNWLYVSMVFMLRDLLFVGQQKDTICW
jgi:hypothetical protein